MARISESFQVLKFCGAILLAEKQLLILPLISGIVISIFFLILLFSMLLVFPLSNEVSVFVEILKYLFLFSLYFITSFVATFSNFAFVSIVYEYYLIFHHLLISLCLGFLLIVRVLLFSLL